MKRDYFRGVFHGLKNLTLWWANKAWSYSIILIGNSYVVTSFLMLEYAKFFCTIYKQIMRRCTHLKLCTVGVEKTLFWRSCVDSFSCQLIAQSMFPPTKKKNENFLWEIDKNFYYVRQKQNIWLCICSYGLNSPESYLSVISTYCLKVFHVGAIIYVII